MNKDELRDYLNKDIETLRALNFSESYIKAIHENTSKWIPLLRGLSDVHVGRNAAILMENQRLFNEQMPEGNPDYAQWKRVSIPVIRRAFSNSFIGYDLVSVQAMRSGQENTYTLGFDGRMIPSMTEARTRAIPAMWESVTRENGVIKFRGETYHIGLDAEAEATAIFSKAVCEEFNREIIRDLALNAGKLSTYDYKDENHLLSLVDGMSSYIAAKCHNREATWIVTSPTIVKLLKEYIEFVDDNPFAEKMSINKIGVLNKKWQIFEDSSASAGDILMGLKDRNHYFSGYVFAPYLPVIPFQENESVMARYGKRLANPNFYGAIKIENLPLEQQPEEIESEE